MPPSCRRTWLGSTPKGSPPDPLMRSSGWTTLTTCNIRDTMEGASSYSRGSGLARCRGFGTRGWEVVGRTWTRRPPIPYRAVVRREGSGSPTRRAPRSAFGTKGRLGYRIPSRARREPLPDDERQHPRAGHQCDVARASAAGNSGQLLQHLPDCAGMAFMRTDSRVPGAGPHPGGSASGVGHRVLPPTPRPRPHGPPAVSLSSGWTRKIDGPAGRGTRPPQSAL